MNDGETTDCGICKYKQSFVGVIICLTVVVFLPNVVQNETVAMLTKAAVTNVTVIAMCRMMLTVIVSTDSVGHVH